MSQEYWLRLVNLPEEYSRVKTLLEIASGVGVPIAVDESTRQRTFGHYARTYCGIDGSIIYGKNF